MKVQWQLREIGTNNIIAIGITFDVDFEGFLRELEDEFLYGTENKEPIGIMNATKNINKIIQNDGKI